MTQKQTIVDDGSLSKYASVIPHMADDDLDPFQMRLYIHYKKLFALNGGCDESVRETAKVTRMSTYAVQKARDELVGLGYVEVEKPTKEEARKGKTVHVTLIDRWAENVSRYAKPVSNLTQGVSNSIQQEPEPVSDLLQVDEKAVSNLTRIDLPHPVDTSKTQKTNPWYEAIQKVWGYTGGRNVDTEKMLRGTATKKPYVDYNLEKPLTDPAQILAWKDWYLKIKNNRAGAVLPGTPEKVQSSIGECQAYYGRKRTVAEANKVIALPVEKTEDKPTQQEIDMKAQMTAKISELAESLRGA